MSTRSGDVSGAGRNRVGSLAAFAILMLSCSHHSTIIHDGGVNGGRDGSVDMATGCTKDSECTAAAPACDISTSKCGSCTSSTSCAGRGTTLTCDTSADTLAGQCVGCVKESDCATAGQACVANACVTCTQNSDCKTGICDASRCVGSTEIIYVDNLTCTSGTKDGTSDANAYCQVNDALPHVSATQKYVKVAGNSDQHIYDAIAWSGVTPLTVEIVGPGKAASIAGNGAVFSETSKAALLVQPTADATITADGLELIGANAPAQAGVSCSGAGGNIALTVRNCYIHDSGGLGVTSNSCAMNLYQSILTGNHGAVSMSSGTYDLQNNFIVGNVAPANGPPISLGGANSGTFTFNTVVGNTTNATYVSGVDCGSGGSKEIYGSIVLGNLPSTATQFTSPSCTLTHVVDGSVLMPTFTAKNATDYHLSKDVGDNVCCIDAILAGDGSATPSVFIDIDGDKRPLGAGWDIGADEAE